MPPDPAASKRALRAEIRGRRRVMPAVERDRANAAIGRGLVELAERQGARSVAAYLSTPEEPSTRGFLDWAQGAGVRVLLPVSRPDGLLDWAPYDGADEDLDWMGMPQPTTELLSPLAINDVDLILVPAAAVDRAGMRMDGAAATSTGRSARWGTDRRSMLSSSTPRSSTRSPSSRRTSPSTGPSPRAAPSASRSTRNPMPTYSYRCTECGNAFDAVQAFTDDALTECPACGGRLRKLYSAVGVTFNGSGFYRTDSRAGAKSESGSAGSAAPAAASTPAASSPTSSSSSSSSSD